MRKAAITFIKSTIAIFAFIAIWQYMNNGVRNDDFSPMLYVFLATIVIGTVRFARWRMKRRKLSVEHQS